MLLAALVVGVFLPGVAAQSTDGDASSEKAQRPGDDTGCSLGEGERRTVTRVIDGETLQVDGGNEVRVIGALAPHVFDAAAAFASWPLAERARVELERLVLGRGVVLALPGRRVDRHGRLLAQVFTEAPDPAAGQLWVQGEMLRRGLARAYALEGNAHCLTEMLAHEAEAREAAAGMWADPAYVVRSADDVGSLLRLAGTFQVVEGNVLRASDVRGVLYLNFGEDQRQDFTVMVRERAARAIIAARLEPQALAGRRVRVRGWIERRGGPMIEAHHPTLIEILERGDSVARSPARKRGRARSRAE